jgi:hypothetical protein
MSDTRRQGTTDQDVADTRVARSSVFLIMILLDGLLMVSMQLNGQQPGQRFYGVLMLLFGGTITAMSIAGVRVNHPLRVASFVALAGVMLSIAVWDYIDEKYQPAMLLGYPIGICIIEVDLAVRVTARRRREAQAERSKVSSKS